MSILSHRSCIMFRTHLLPLCCFTVSFITRINSYTIGIVGTTSVSTNLRTWYSGSYILRFFYLECRHKVTKKSILHIYKLIGTYLILFGISFTHLSHKQFFFRLLSQNFTYFTCPLFGSLSNFTSSIQ
jgi:hypothetical protein